MTVEQGGGGEEKDGDRRRPNSQQDGRAQRGRGARSEHENNLPLGGRVQGHVQLYGERGWWVVGADRETGTAGLEREVKHQHRHTFRGDERRDDGLKTRRAPKESRGKSSVGRRHALGC